VIENRKEFMTDAQIQDEDSSTVTCYRPEKCDNGYAVLSFEMGPPQTRLIDMNGRIVNVWRQRSERSKYLENSHLLMVGRTRQQILEFDWEGNLVWEYLAPGIVHHDACRLANGNTVFLYREPVPQEFKDKSEDPQRRQISLQCDVILEVTPDKQTVFEWHQYEHFDIDWHKPDRQHHADWTHTNTVNCLPQNKWHDAGDSRFKPGNYLISMRSLDTILIVDRDTGDIAWKYGGNYRGGLSGQHEPNMIPKGRQGAGNILIFDNGVEQAHHGASVVLELNPVSLAVEWTYQDEDFYSGFRSTVERLPNGNTFINEADHKRIFEITAEGEIVWEYWLPETWRAGRCHRVAYDYGDRLLSLPKPVEVPVEAPLQQKRPLPVY
jgi:hypothetical protein